MPAKSNGTIARENGNNGEVIQQHTAFRALCLRLDMEASDESENDTFGSPMISGVEAILAADTEAEMWEADDLTQTGGRNLEDKEMSITDYGVRYGRGSLKSMFVNDKGAGMYLLVKSVDLVNGEEFVWNTSAPFLVAKILWLADNGKLPAECVIRGADAGEGRVLKLRPLPKRAVQSTVV